MAPTDSIAGTSQGGEALGVPVVDLTATVQGLYEHAETCRAAAYALMAGIYAPHTALTREADYLEDLASLLSTGVPRG